MRIELQQVGKRYRRDWILRQISFDFVPGGRYAITGPNGAGKSTLLRVLSGHLSPSRGKVNFWDGSKAVRVEEVYKHLSYAAPYIELVEEFSLTEAIDFHRRFKPFQQNMTTDDAIGILDFGRARHAQIRDFSSGMKQRLKLALALLSQTPILLLDEPTTNLDAQGAEWYLGLVNQFAAQRLLVVASNVPDDYRFCDQQLHILDYK